MPKVVIAGGTGFIGRALVADFVGSGWEVVLLSRSGSRNSEIRTAAWDGKRQGDWSRELEGAEAVLNLSGAPIDQVWTDPAKEEIRRSRVDSTLAIGTALADLKIPPKVWINSSAIGWYGDTGTFEVSEASPAGKGFLADTCEAWEAAVDEVASPVRKVKMRTGVVLGRGGGALEPLLKLTKLGLGGAAGNGRQFISWIHLQDLLALYRWVVETPEIQGPVNATSPNPVTNAVFMQELRSACHRPWSPPVPAFMLSIGARAIGTQPDLILISQRVAPQIAEAHDFPFRFPTLREALKNLI
ncbi:MAG: TIGR01777 family oxidoreductase [Fimbriimonadaceae bacterium]|nr:TIGR01777 family oxidoreductase [Fimbriimonadaceae bacterium]